MLSKDAGTGQGVVFVSLTLGLHIRLSVTGAAALGGVSAESEVE